MTLLSNACEYGLRASLYVATRADEGYVPIRRIAEALSISGPFLTKVFQQLTQAGLMTSYRGPKGGVALAKPADEITLHDLVVAIDGPDLFTECVLGLPGCGDHTPCPLHARWTSERLRLHALFTSTTLAALADDFERFDLRLAPATTP